MEELTCTITSALSQRAEMLGDETMTGRRLQAITGAVLT
jgi:hypothetical protein